MFPIFSYNFQYFSYIFLYFPFVQPFGATTLNMNSVGILCPQVCVVSKSGSVVSKDNYFQPATEFMFKVVAPKG